MTTTTTTTDTIFEYPLLTNMDRETTVKWIARWQNQTNKSLFIYPALRQAWPEVTLLSKALTQKFGTTFVLFSTPNGWSEASWHQFNNICITGHSVNWFSTHPFSEYTGVERAWNRKLPGWTRITGIEVALFVLLHEYVHIHKHLHYHDDRFTSVLMDILDWYVAEYRPAFLERQRKTAQSKSPAK